MNTEVFEMLASTHLQYGHMIAFQGLDTWRNSYITEGKSFCETTDLSGSVDAELGDRVVNAIASFGVAGVRADSIECGPVVTRVNLVLPRGVRIKAVADLANDLALQLKVASVSFLRSSKKSLKTLIEQGLAMASNNPEITYANIMRVDYHNFDGLTETFSETEYDVIHKDGKAVLANKQKRQH